MTTQAQSGQNRREIEGLERKIEKLAREQRENEETAKDLMARELEGQGPFAAEIFQCKQAKMRLATEIHHLRVRINHLLLGLPGPEGS